MKKIAKSIGWCLLALIPLCACGQSTANPFVLQSSSQIIIEKLSQTFQSNGLYTVGLSSANPVYGVAVSGHVAFQDASNSMVRVTAVCFDGIEYLVYETSPLFADGQDFDIEDIAMETAMLDAENIVRLNVMLVNATFTLTDVKYNKEPVQNVSQRRSVVAVDQEEALISRLNENLEKQGHLWRAGKTSLSNLTYEQKKAIFGDTVPYLGGFEYYVGGIFAMPDYVPQKASDEDALFVKEWDWRNRHGKNWMTSVKDQGNCGSCYVFAAVGATESYVNLYYNKLINYDLSEQQMVSCVSNGCAGGVAENVLKYIQNKGIVPEKCYPYIAVDGDCNRTCNQPEELVKIGDVNPISSSSTISELKKELFNAPLCFSIASWGHAMTLVGYKKLAQGDYIYINPNYQAIRIDQTHSLIGENAWLVKNSWGKRWGDNGFGYVVVDISNTRNKASIKGVVESQKLTDDDIVVEDADSDGFYFWGIGNRPSSLPDWVPMEPDGDDSDPTKGAMDDYGNLKPSGKIKNVRTNTTWTSLGECLPIVFIEKGATLTLKGNICLYPDSRIFVKEGGSLILDGVTLDCASIKVYNGGYIKIMNGAILRREESDIFDIESGGLMDWVEGTIVEK